MVDLTISAHLRLPFLYASCPVVVLWLICRPHAIWVWINTGVQGFDILPIRFTPVNSPETQNLAPGGPSETAGTSRDVSSPGATKIHVNKNLWLRDVQLNNPRITMLCL